MSITRVSHVPAHLADQLAEGNNNTPAPAPTSRVYGEAVRYTNGQAEAEQIGQARHTLSQDGVAGGSVLATLRNEGRLGQSVELIPGRAYSRTNVMQALRDGLLVRGADGRLQDSPNMAAAVESLQQGPAEEQPTQADPGADAFTPDGDAAWQAAVDDLPQHAYESAVAAGVGVAAMGGDVGSVARSLVRNTGMEPSQAAALAQQGMDHFADAADRALAPMGITGDRLEAFYADLKGKPDQLQEAVQALVFQRDPSVFKKAAVTYLRQNPPDMSMFTAAGYQMAIDPETGEMLTQRGTGPWVKVSDLAKVEPAKAPSKAPAQREQQQQQASTEWVAIGEGEEAEYRARGYEVDRSWDDGELYARRKGGR